MSFLDFIGDFLDGFGPGLLFSNARRLGAATQVFATKDVPCDPYIQFMANHFTSSEQSRFEYEMDGVLTEHLIEAEQDLQERLLGRNLSEREKQEIRDHFACEQIRSDFARHIRKGASPFPGGSSEYAKQSRDAVKIPHGS